MEPIRFMTSLLTFYLKGEIRQDGNFLRLSCPNTLLTFIPLGSRKENLPLNQISSVSTTVRFSLKRVLVGLVFVFLILIALESYDGFLFMPILLILAANNFLNAVQTFLIIQTTSGGILVVFFNIFEKSKAELAEREIMRIISYKMDEGNRNTDRIVESTEAGADKITDAIKNFRQ